MDNNPNNFKKYYDINERYNRQENLLNKKRLINGNDQQNEILSQYNYLNNVENNEMLKLKIHSVILDDFDKEKFENYKNLVFSNDIFDQHEGIIQIKKLTLNKINLEYVYYKIIDNQMIPLFINFMKNYKQPHLQIESCWIITNLLSKDSKFIKLLIDKNILGILIDLTLNGFDELKEQSIFGLTNIISEKLDFIIIAIKQNIIESIMKIITTYDVNSKLFYYALKFLYVVSFIINNENEKKDLKKHILNKISIFKEVFINLLLQNNNNEEYFKFSITFLNSFKNDFQYSDQILTNDILIKLLMNGYNINDEMINEYLGLIYFFSLENKFIPIFLQYNIFELILKWLENENLTLIIFKFILNLIDDYENEIINVFFKNKNLINKIKCQFFLSNKVNDKIKLIGLDIFNTYFNYFNINNINELLEENYVEIYKYILENENNNLVILNTLKGIEYLLNKNNNMIFNLLLEKKIINKIFDLQKHHDFEIYKTCINIISTYLKK